MFSVVFVVISFIAIIGITLVIVEAHNAPLLADDEMTTISYPNHNTHNTQCCLTAIIDLSTSQNYL